MRTDTLWLEGMPEVIEARLYRPEWPEPIRFSTYVPPDIIAEPGSSGAEHAVRFIANFAGRRNDDAVLALFVHPASTSEAEARALARSVAESRGLREHDADAAPRFDWSIVEYGFRDCDDTGCLVGTVAVGRHGTRPFQVLVQYPQEYADGFSPRADYIIEELRWY
ncbi:MAG: hypothetical protein ACRELD_02770 [Longimicrobiales bacterium]